MRPVVTTEVIDRGWKRIKRELKKAESAFTKVGLPMDGTVKEGTKEGSDRDPVSLSELITVGAVHEFGAPKKNIPKRPFLRVAFKKNRSGIKRMSKMEYKAVVAGTRTTRVALGRIGEWMTDQTKATIRQMTKPKLKAATVDRKGSSALLIDTGQLIQSIQHVETMK